MHRPGLLLLSASLFLGMPVAAPAEVRGLKVITNRTIDASSLESIVRQVFERSGARTNDERAIALYEYLHNTIFHWAYPTEAAPQSVGPLKVIKVYGWGLCGGQHTVLKALYETAGWNCRYVGWPGHTTIEVQYDGKWHYLDVFLKCYYWTKDRSHVAGQEEIAADPSIVLDAVKEGRAARQNLCCGDEATGVVAGCRARQTVGDSKGWASVTWRDESYSPQLRLPAAATLRLDWKSEPGGFAVSGAPPQHSCGMKDIRNDKVLGPIAEHYGPRSWSSGQLVYNPDFARKADVADIELKGAEAKDGKLTATRGTGVAIFKLPLPYAYVSAKLEATFDGGEGKLAVSADGGNTWQTATAGDISRFVKQHYDVWIKAVFPGSLAGFRLEAVIEHNRGAQPYLMPGRNKITVAVDQGDLPRNTMLALTYAYQEASLSNPEKRSHWDGRGLHYGPIKKVTKKIAMMPFSFDINIGGNTPPKMHSLEYGCRSD